jgi:hypothetical protein
VVSELGWWDYGVWRRRLMWHWTFLVWEEELVRQLLNLIAQGIVSETPDRWVRLRDVRMCVFG